MRGLDLFSGIGGITLALCDYVEPVAYVEIDRYCQALLLSRMHTGELPRAPIWDDVTILDARELPEIDIITAGFPCQDISCAGLGKGLEGKRSGLFFEILRLAKEIKPKFIFLENVPAITSRGGLRVVREIATLGYDCRWCVISAQSVVALHRRERWFLLAHSTSQGSDRHISREEEAHTMFAQCRIDGHTNSKSSQQTDTSCKPNETERGTWGRSARVYWPLTSVEHWQETVRTMDKCSDGISYHTHRLRAIGNSVVPEQARQAFELLAGLNI